MQGFDAVLNPEDDAALGQLFDALAEEPRPAELAGLEVILPAFREALSPLRPAVPGRHHRRLRLAMTGAPASLAVAAAIVFPTSAVAAAYTGHLPDQVQRWAHAALHTVGVPGPRHHTAGPAHRTSHGSRTVDHRPGDNDRPGPQTGAPELRLQHPRCRGPLSEPTLRRLLPADEYKRIVTPGAAHLYLCAPSGPSPKPADKPRSAPPTSPSPTPTASTSPTPPQTSPPPTARAQPTPSNTSSPR